MLNSLSKLCGIVICQHTAFSDRGEESLLGGNKILEKLFNDRLEYLEWYTSLNGRRFENSLQESYMAIEMCTLIIDELQKGNDACKAIAAEMQNSLNKSYSKWRSRVKI